MWDMGELWETKVKSVASQHVSLGPGSPHSPPSLLLLCASLFLFWQGITGGSMQITYGQP